MMSTCILPPRFRDEASLGCKRGDLGASLQLDRGSPCRHRFLVVLVVLVTSFEIYGWCLGISQAMKRMRIYGTTEPNASLLRDIRKQSHLAPNCEIYTAVSPTLPSIADAFHVALRLSFRLLASAIHVWLTHGFASEQDSRTVPWDH